MSAFLRSAKILILSVPFLASAAFAVPAASLATPVSGLSVDTQVRLLGGYTPLGADASLPQVQRITQSPAWRTASAHESLAALMRNSAGMFSAGSISQMQRFFGRAAGSATQDSRNILYLFGGADILYPTVLFPNMTRTLVVGLEEPGQLWNPEDLSANGTLADQMSQVATAYKDLLQLSFFVSEHMSNQLQQFGTVTMLSVGLVARGNQILKVVPVSLNPKGQLVAGLAGRVKGSLIQYAKPNGQTAEVVYLKMYLNDQNLVAMPEFAAYLQTGAFDTAYYKAASYVSHDASVINLNRLVLASVRHVIQNDDGLPLSALRETSANWSLKLFGHYSKVSRLFPVGTDEDMRAAYDQSLCSQAHGDDLSIWKRQWPDACRGSLTSFNFASLSWDGSVPFRYGYTWTMPAGGDKSKYSNLQVMDRVR